MEPFEEKVLLEAAKQLTKDVYSDGLAPVMREIGKFGSDAAKAIRYLLSPVQYLAHRQDRLAAHLARTLELVPEDRRIEPNEAILIPAVERLAYYPDGSEIARLYTSLLARAMDRERVGEAHPAFVQLIGQLAPDEALFIDMLSRQPFTLYARSGRRGGEIMLKREYEAQRVAENLDQDGAAKSIYFEVESLAQPALFSTFLEHLESLGLVAYSNDPWNQDFVGWHESPFGRQSWFICLTEFGRLFHRACVEASPSQSKK